MSTAVSSHSGAGPLSLMSCVRESSPPQDVGNEYEPEKNVSSKKKFWNPRKWFKRKSNKVVEEIPNSLITETNQTLRSRSTSELSVAEEQTRRRSGTPMHPGLSVSHDSVFHSPHSGSELELEAAQSSSSLSISHQPTQPDNRLQTELIERLRQRRGDTSEDDEGLPHSPCNSPTTTEGHLEKSHNKDLPTKSHSTCSDGSLLSMGSYEMDEDSFDPQSHSRHASKLSLQEKNKDVTDADITEWGPTNSSFPLNHSAAHHKVSIRPKRTHGAPRRKPAVLPTTPEVNEDSSHRIVTLEGTSQETLTELYTSMSYHHQHIMQDHDAQPDYKMKCSSLPPGLLGPGGLDNSKLTRSRSNAGGTHGQESFAEEDEYGDHKNKDTSFFGRIFPRRSGKKKKQHSKEEKEVKEANVAATYTTSYSSKVIESSNVNYDPFDRSMIAVDSNLAIRPNALRTGPASRQRVQPIDIPSTPELAKHNEELNNSPLRDELDEWFQKHSTVMSTSMTEASPVKSSPPKSPLMFSMSPPKSPWSEKRHLKNVKTTSKFVEHTTSQSTTESKSVVRIAGLSPLQQRVISLNDDTDTGFNSLTNLPTDYYEKPTKPVAKAHSFKSTNTNVISDLKVTSCYKSLDDKNIFKSMSLDSVKNVDDQLDIETGVVSEQLKKAESHEMEHNASDVTISGPSHKAIVNISSSHEAVEKMMITTNTSVTKVQLNRETASQVTTVTMKPLSKLSENATEVPKMHRKSSLDLDRNIEPSFPVRKFSNDNIEVIRMEDLDENKKEVGSPMKSSNSFVTVTSMTNASHYRKNSESTKRDHRPVIRTKSNSFDSVESTPRSSQSSLDKLETKSQENIKISSDSVVRRRSLVKQRQDEEPELMKVFARRSLKLKDSDIETLQQQVAKMVENDQAADAIKNNIAKSRDSDKENLSDSSPVEDRKKPMIAPKTSTLLETKMKIDGIDITLRKPIGNKLAAFQQRPVTTTPVAKNDSKVLKPNARPKTEIKHDEVKNKEAKDLNNDVTKTNIINTAEIISSISEKTELIQDGNVEVQNFRLRKAEWEKRAQESIRKTGP